MSETTPPTDPDEAAREAAVRAFLEEKKSLDEAAGEFRTSSEIVSRIIETMRARLASGSVLGRSFESRPALADEGPEANEILDRVTRELGPLEERVQRLMHHYGL